MEATPSVLSSTETEKPRFRTRVRSRCNRASVVIVREVLNGSPSVRTISRSSAEDTIAIKAFPSAVQ